MTGRSIVAQLCDGGLIQREGAAANGDVVG
jgi:hypothetical protein